MIRKPEAFWLSLAARLWPGVLTAPRDSQVSAAADLLGIVLGLPFALAGVVWLITATDLSVIATAWPGLLVVGAVIWFVQRQQAFILMELSPGRFGDSDLTVDGPLNWALRWTYGPAAIWINVILAGLFWWDQRRQIRQSRYALLTLRNMILSVVATVFAPLVGLHVFMALGGTLPVAVADPLMLLKALAALAIYGLTAMVIPAVYLVMVGRYYTEGAIRRRVLLRFAVLVLSLPLIADVFGLLGALLLNGSGWFAFALYAVAVVVVAALAHRFSRAAEQSRRQARHLERLEQFSRALLTPTDDLDDEGALSLALRDHLPGMFPPPTRLEVWLGPDQVLARHPETAEPCPEGMWAWLIGQREPHLIPERASRPWGGAHHEEHLIVVPIVSQSSGEGLGGIALSVPTRTPFANMITPADLKDLVPAATALAAQIAAALARADAQRAALEHQKRSQELAFAGQVQASFLPDAVPQLPGWQFSAWITSARETSGDFFDFIALPDGRLALTIADVADKGTGAALYMALSRTLLRTYAREYVDDPVRVMTATNQRLLEDVRANMFVSAFYGVLDPHSGELVYVNAGHNPPLWRNQGVHRLLKGTGPVLGALPDLSWRCERIGLAPGDVVTLYTDGLTDALDADGAFYGQARLEAVVSRFDGGTAQTARNLLQADIADFRAEAPLADDITLVIVRRDPLTHSLNHPLTQS
ncbi:MAG TPA: PP2C family protein-serine/threonine phosphatase [Anaerolineales bacterium]|nr:PP2C family protein-serine/threonine phosphatase [Anaerolineales bacterium]